MQLGVNHLAHFLLTNLVRPMLEVSGRARVVSVSSGGHNLSDIVWDDPNYVQREYDKWEAYGQSKTANALFALALDQRLVPFGGHAYSVHPGMVGTRLARYLEKGDFKSLMSRGASRQSTTGSGQSEARERVPMKSVEAGAATTVWAVVAPLDHLDLRRRARGVMSKDDVTTADVLRRNFWFCALDGRSGFLLKDVIGVDNILVESDYPHSDSSWPNTQPMLAKHLAARHRCVRCHDRPGPSCPSRYAVGSHGRMNRSFFESATIDGGTRTASSVGLSRGLCLGTPYGKLVDIVLTITAKELVA